MPNEIATTDTSSLDLLPPAQPPSAGAQAMLLSHAEMMQTAWELADRMCRTALIPDRFRNKPEDATAAILYGGELGLNPIQSLQRVIPIYGMPTLEARTMVALLKARGYRFHWIKKTDTECAFEGWSPDGEQHEESTWTIDDAVRRGYVPKIDEKTGKYRVNAKGNLIGNEKYLTDPKAMLKAKCQAEVCRDLAPEILLGIAYTAEEMRSEQLDRPAPQRRPLPEPITVAEIFGDTPDDRRPPPDTTPPDDSGVRPATPTATGEDGGLAAPQTTADIPPELRTETQFRKIMALMKKAGITDRDDQLTIIADILGYHVDSRKNLDTREAHSIIDRLETWLAATDYPITDRINDILNQAGD